MKGLKLMSPKAQTDRCVAKLLWKFTVVLYCSLFLRSFISLSSFPDPLKSSLHPLAFLVLFTSLPVYSTLSCATLFFPFQMSEIKTELDTLPFRTLLASGFITYLSAASEDRRRHCLETWMSQSGLQSKYTTTTFYTQRHKHMLICLLVFLHKCHHPHIAQRTAVTS